MTTVAYRIEVDWDGDGSWDHAETDITADVSGARWSHGRSSDVDYDYAGSLSVSLRNPTGKYNSGNASSPIYGLIKPNRKVRAIMSVSGTDATMFGGFLEKLTPTIAIPSTASTATLSAYGPLAQFTDTEFDIPMQEAIKTGDAVDIILDGAGWPAGDRTLDAGLTTIAKYYIEDGYNRLSAMRDMQDMEFGRLRESKDGKIVFDSRDAIFASPHDTAQATYGTGTLCIKEISQVDSLPGIYNAVRARCRTMSVTPEVALATVVDINAGFGAVPIYLAAGASTTIDIKLPDNSYYKSVYAWTSCAVTANANATGTSTDLTAAITASGTSNGNSYRVLITNTGGTPAYLTRIVGYGYGVAEDNSLTVTSDDATSQTAHGLRVYPHPGKWFYGPNQAISHANHGIALFKDQRPRIQFKTTCVVEPVAGVPALTIAHALDIQAREIGDRIHIGPETDTGLALNADFIIDRIEHSIAPGRPHERVILCTQAPTAELVATGVGQTFRYVMPPPTLQEQLSTYDSGQPGEISSLTLNIDEGLMWFSFARPTTNYKGISYICISLATGATHHGPYAAQRAANAADVLDSDTGLAVQAGQLTFALASGTPNLWAGKVLLIYKTGDTGLDAHVIASDSGSAIVMSSAFFSSGTYNWAVVEPYYTQNAHDYVFDLSQFDNFDIEDATWKTKKIPIEVGTWYAQGYALNKYGLSSSIATSAQTAVAHVRTGATYRTTATANRGIRLDSGYLRVYDGSGNEKLSANASTGAISVTGAITAGAGSNIGTAYLDGPIGVANLDIANRGWVQTCAFSVTDADTVAWGAGTFTAADGTAYSINAGNTGNMSAKNYIYLDTAVSNTAYQKTTTAASAVGAGKVLIAIAQNNTTEATFMVMNGQGGQNIDASQIVAGSITANEIAASTITTGKLAATAIDSMTVTGATIRTAASGAGIYLDSTNGLQAKDSSGNVLTQIALNGVTTLKTSTGSSRVEFDANGLSAYYGSTLTTQVTSGVIWTSDIRSLPTAELISLQLMSDESNPHAIFYSAVNGPILTINTIGGVVGKLCPRYLEVTNADPLVYGDLEPNEIVSVKNTDSSVYGIAVRFGTSVKSVQLS